VNIPKTPGTTPSGQPLDMDGLLLLTFGASAFQILHSAVRRGLLDELAAHPGPTKEVLMEKLGLAQRPADILLLGTTALGLTVKSDGRYYLPEVLADLAETDDWKRYKDVVLFQQVVAYAGSVDFDESLTENRHVGLRRIPGTGPTLYHRLHQNPLMQQAFYAYMRSWSELAAPHLVRCLDLRHSTRLLDVGGGDAVVSLALAEANPDLRCDVLELDENAPVTRERIAEAGLEQRVNVLTGDMFTSPFPPGVYDTILYAHQMVIWTLDEDVLLLTKAYEALPDGGRVVILNSMSNDAGDGPLVPALDSVYFAALPAEGGMIYSWQQYEECLAKAGFTSAERIVVPGWTPHGIIIATK
jgi:L-tyrosine C(3)-methyltransferase